MSTTVKTAWVLTPVVEQTQAQELAEHYLQDVVCVAFCATDGVFIPFAEPRWQFAIDFSLPGLGRLGIMGTIDVDATTGQVFPFSEEQIEMLQERTSAIVLHYKATHQALRRSGVDVALPTPQISKQSATRLANQYLHNQLGNQSYAGRGLFVPTGSPVWMFDICAYAGRLALDVICVNALTGQVIPLSTLELNDLAERIAGAAALHPSSTTRAG